MQSIPATKYVFSLLLLTFFFTSPTLPQSQAQDFTNSFSVGREYFILRSGNAKLILQSDNSGMQPAFFYLLFDANTPCQTLKKERAFNYTSEKQCYTSALEMVLGGTAFTALGQNCNVHWADHDGIPAVEACWWAGGIEVKESFLALEGSNTFIRKITLNPKGLAGPDSVRIRLRLPAEKVIAHRAMLVGIARAASLGLAFSHDVPVVINEKEGFIESLPISLVPGHTVVVKTYLVTQIPAAGYTYAPNCGGDQTIRAEFLRRLRKLHGPVGLKGEYYNNPSLHGTPALVRTDTNLAPYWDTGSPDAAIRPDSFSVRWTGYLVPPATGTYRFSLAADDRARLYLDNKLLIDCWKDSWNVTKTAEKKLQAATLHRIRVDYADLKDWAGVRLKWALPIPPPDKKAAEAGVEKMFTALEGTVKSMAAGGLEQTKEHWNQINSIDTPDSLLLGLYNHARFSLPGMVGPGGLMDAGIFEYGDQWVRDGSNVTLGLIYAGHFESARALLNHILEKLVSADGATVVSGSFDQPDREEFDQMGVLMHALKAYRDWTGDSALIMTYRAKIIAMIERPLDPRFRDSTGMVHNRREYWERTLNDGYELAYQTYMIRGLQDAADLAGTLGVPERATVWLTQARIIREAMLHHPSRSLVDQGALIKRRNIDGSVAVFMAGPKLPSKPKDDPLSTEAYHWLNPDATYALPIFLRVIDPTSELSIRSLDKLETIWNGRWCFGGYERYHSSSQMDQPGPWTFATASIARAQHDAGLLDRSRRSLEWLFRIQGGNAGAWFEEIPLTRSQIPSAGIIPWTSAEVTMFAVREWLGLSFEGRDLVIRPNLYQQDFDVRANLRFRSARLRLEIDRPGAIDYAFVDGKKIFPREDGSIVIPAERLTRDVSVAIIAKRL
jgi:hypothetical protein